MERIEQYRRLLPQLHQQHLLAFWDSLDDARRSQLLNDLDQVDFERCAPLIDTHVRTRPEIQIPERLEPPHTLPASPGPDQVEMYERARAAGVESIRAGRVAAFTVAGGQGTRLGFDGPKGMFRISPVRGVSLFQWFAEFLAGVRRRYGRAPRWYIMTSPSNDPQTRRFFQENVYFGLGEQGVRFFPQRQMPAFLPDGRIAMSDRHRVALSPDGHGGSLTALAESGALAEMQRDGVEHISYFQVDNPLVRCVDPLFVGLHIVTGSEMSSKVVSKAHDLERVGVFAIIDGRPGVLEYSDLPEELARARNPDGSRRFDAGNIAIHILSRAFAERIATRGSTLQLPWHRAEKKAEIIDDAGRPVTPDKPNVVKLERFVFDAIALARSPLVLFTERAEEFSPVKNAEGDDSPASARRDMIRRAARWLEACGCRVPRTADGEPAMPLEISPARALDAGDLRERLAAPPALQAATPLLLE